MIGRAVFLASLGLALALLGSFSLLSRLPAPAPVAAASATAAESPAAEAPAPPKRQSSSYREALLEADQRGQYGAQVLVEGVSVPMLIDTGASEVCVSASTAARLGLAPASQRRYTIKTANGLSTASPTILRSVSLDGLYMNDVEALILAPEAGEVNLLGESFSGAWSASSNATGRWFCGSRRAIHQNLLRWMEPPAALGPRPEAPRSGLEGRIQLSEVRAGWIILRDARLRLALRMRSIEFIRMQSAL